jgi:hypothetical protein
VAVHASRSRFAALRRAIVLFVVLVTSLTQWGRLASSGTRLGNPRVSAVDRSGRGTPTLAFEPNVGQVDSRVKFLSRASGATTFLTSTGVVLALHPPAATGDTGSVPESATSGSGLSSGDVFRLAFVGADPSVRVVGSDLLPAVSNYYIGADPNAWHAGVSQFGKVIYQDLYRGVDASFYGNEEGQLEYDFSVAPGVDPSQIRLTFQGSAHPTLDERGNLLLHLAAGTIRQPPPRMYQEIGGSRRTIVGRFSVSGDTVGFDVGAFDPSRPLIIDPEIVYSTLVGGTGSDWDLAQPIAVDAQGDALRCGGTDSIDFPITDGAVQPSLAGSHDVAIFKLNSQGSGLLSSTYLGGTAFDGAFGCTVDRRGRAYVVGSTQSSDFPITPGALQTTFAGGDAAFCQAGIDGPFEPCDGFVAKLGRTGSLIYSTFLGGSGDEEVSAVQADARGVAVVAGFTSSADFPVTAGAYQTTLAGNSDYFVASLNPSGTRLRDATYLGGSDDEFFDPGVAMGSHGDIYLTSGTPSADFPTTPGAFQPTFSGVFDSFVTRFSPTLSALQYSTYVGGTDFDLTTSNLTVDPAGEVTVDGATVSTDFPTTDGAFQTSNAGGFDAFISKLNATGSGLIYSTYLGGSGDDLGAGSTVDPRGRVFEATVSSSTDFPVTTDAFQPANAGGFDMTVTELTKDASGLVFSSYLGGSSDEFGARIELDRFENLYVDGCTTSADFPTTPGAFQRTFNGGDGTGWCFSSDLFVTKIAFDDEAEQAKAVTRGPAGTTDAGARGRWPRMQVPGQ